MLTPSVSHLFLLALWVRRLSRKRQIRGLIRFCVGTYFLGRIILLLLLQRSTAVQVRSSVRLMPQNQLSGKGLLPSPTAWSPDQHLAAMFADVSRHILGRTEGRGLGFGQLVRTHKGKCLKCQSSSDGHSDHMPCAQAEDSGLPYSQR